VKIIILPEGIFLRNFVGYEGQAYSSSQGHTSYIPYLIDNSVLMFSEREGFLCISGDELGGNLIIRTCRVGDGETRNCWTFSGCNGNTSFIQNIRRW
jgi:hypothetical protein